MSQTIEITPNAQEYLVDLLSGQEQQGVGVRIFVLQPGTPQAETCLAYCRPGEEKEGDVKLEGMPFPTYLEEKSLPYLEEANIDYNKDRMGGQLTIKAPNSKLPKVSVDSTLEERVNYVLWTEVNPMLASHGGEVSLMEVADETVAVLKFGGGCQGCSSVDVTLKEGVEKTLREHIPELTEIRDITDHEDRANAYY